MASDIVLEIDTIKGESASKSGGIDIMSFSWGLSNSGTFAQGGGGGAGKASFQDIHFSSHTSKASAALAKACAQGDHIAKSTLHVRKQGGGTEPKEWLTIKLEDVLVSSYQSGGADGQPTDQFSLNYAKIHYETKVQDAKGAVTAGSEFKYDLKTLKSS